MFKKIVDLSDFISKASEVQNSVAFSNIDLIYTFSGEQAGCCIANDCGIKYGIQSTYSKRRCLKHNTIFVDNSYHKYNHQEHLKIVKELRPKYCTVRDAMTKEQCERDKIEYYAPSQIADWAEELKQYAENVIIIPKSAELISFFNWNDFICGVPVPSSYGSDMLEIKYYKDKKCHLLGGSWAKQLSLLYILSQNIVSLDNNYIYKIAKNGLYVDPSGQTHQIKEILNFRSKNVINICLSISLGAIKYAVESLAWHH